MHWQIGIVGTTSRKASGSSSRPVKQIRQGQNREKTGLRDGGGRDSQWGLGKGRVRCYAVCLHPLHQFAWSK